MTKSAFVALVGRPNAGKSTLLNALVGTKIAAVSSKPQTTRNRIVGIRNSGDTQLVFFDTPGIHHGARHQLNQFMNSAAWEVVEDADITLFLIDVEAGWTKWDEELLRKVIPNVKGRLGILATKTDRIKNFILTERIKDITNSFNAILQEGFPPEEIEKVIQPFPFMVSAKRRESVNSLVEFLDRHSEEGPWFYEYDQITDMNEAFVFTELIREQIFRKLSDEIPYGCGIKIEKIERLEHLTRIMAVVVVERDAHKRIFIGKEGSQIKSIGTSARESLEKFIQKKVHLELFVKVEPGWTNKPHLIAEYTGLRRDENTMEDELD